MAKVNITEDQIINYLKDRKKELTADLEKVTKALNVLETPTKAAASPAKVTKPEKQLPSLTKPTITKVIKKATTTAKTAPAAKPAPAKATPAAKPAPVKTETKAAQATDEKTPASK